MSVVPVRELVSAVKPVLRAPLAITCEGEIVLNVGELTHLPTRQEIIGEALRMNEPLFIGLRLTPAELRKVLARLDNAIAEGVAHIVGQRRRRFVTRRRRTTKS